MFGEPMKVEYKDYIGGHQWARRRSQYFMLHERQCRRCASKRKIHLHHLTYARLGNELDLDLMALCERCHALVHEQWKKERNLSLEEVTRKMVHGREVRRERRANPPRHPKLGPDAYVVRTKVVQRKPRQPKLTKSEKRARRLASKNAALPDQIRPTKVARSSGKASVKQKKYIKHDVYLLSRQLERYHGTDAFLLAMKAECERLPPVYRFNGWRPNADQIKRMLESLPK